MGFSRVASYCLVLGLLCIVPAMLLGQDGVDRQELMNAPSIELDSAAVVLPMETEIHALAFDHHGTMYVAGKCDVYRITPEKAVTHFASLADRDTMTSIWSMRFGADGRLYCAAHDRIVAIAHDGSQQVIIQEKFTGPCGATDLRFDQSGALYVAYDRFIARYDSTGKKSIFIDGGKFQRPIQWAVGMEFSSDERTMFVADCGASYVYTVRLGGDDLYRTAEIHPTVYGQYFTRDRRGTVYLTSMGGHKKAPELVLFRTDNSLMTLRCRQKPPQNEQRYKKTIAFGDAGFDERAVYCVIGNTIYSYHLAPFDR